MAPKTQSITIRYLGAVAFIYFCTSIAWLYLGAVTEHRTRQKDAELRSEVGQIWGGLHHQIPPTVTLAAIKPPPTMSAGEEEANDSKEAADKKADAAEEPDEQDVTLQIPVACTTDSVVVPTATNATAALDLEHRRKGLLWYSTYGVRFDGTFTFNNDTPCERRAELFFPFPAGSATYDDFSVMVGDEEVPFEVTGEGHEKPQNGALAAVMLPARSNTKVRVRYASRGLDRWSYSFGANTARAKDFKLVVRTNFDKVDFPAGSLSPSQKQRVDGGWELSWGFTNLLADAGIAVTMPRKLNPGPLASEISRFAPVSLFFFFFVLLLVTAIKKVRLHPVHFGLLAAAFFSFHLLTAYLVDHVPMWLAFCASSVVSVALVVSYLRLAIGARFALLWAGGAQLLYLVLFSLAFFLEGYTGLTITVFSILTLFLVMQLTARIDWSTIFVGKPSPPPHAPHPSGCGPVPQARYGPAFAVSAPSVPAPVFSQVT